MFFAHSVHSHGIIRSSMATSVYSVRTSFEGEKALGVVLLPRDGIKPINLVFILLNKNDYYGGFDLLTYEEGVGFVDNNKYKTALNEAERYFKNSYYSYYYTQRHNSLSSTLSGAIQLEKTSDAYPDKVYLGHIANDLAESIIAKATKKNWAEAFPTLLKLARICRLNYFSSSLVRSLLSKEIVRRDCAIYFAASASLDFFAQASFQQAGLLAQFEKSLLSKSLDLSEDLLRGLSRNFPHFTDPQIQDYCLEHFDGEGIELTFLIDALSKKDRIEDLFKLINRNSSYNRLLCWDVNSLIPVLQAYAMRVGKEKAAEFANSLIYSTCHPYVYSYLANFSSLQDRLSNESKFPKIRFEKRYSMEEHTFVEIESTKEIPIYNFEGDDMADLLVSGIVKISSLFESDLDYLKKRYRADIRSALNEAKNYRKVSRPKEAALSMEAAIVLEDTASYKNISDDALSLCFGNSNRFHLIRAKAAKSSPKKMPLVHPYSLAKKGGK